MTGEEVAAGTDDRAELQKARRGQQRLDRVLPDLDRAGVAVLDERVERIARHLLERDLFLLAFAQLPRKHGAEVGGRGRQHQPVGGYSAGQWWIERN